MDVLIYLPPFYATFNTILSQLHKNLKLRVGPSSNISSFFQHIIIGIYYYIFISCTEIYPDRRLQYFLPIIICTHSLGAGLAGVDNLYNSILLQFRRFRKNNNNNNSNNYFYYYYYLILLSLLWPVPKSQTKRRRPVSAASLIL